MHAMIFNINKLQSMNDHISIPPSAADAYRAMLAEQAAPLEEATIENAAQLNEAEENEFAWTKQNKKENYSRFLDANNHRVGKPMVDGGLSAERVGSAANGQEVKDVIYCGDGCITYNEKGKKIFTQMNADLLNTSDGTVSWSDWKNYRGNARISVPASEFKDIAKAVALAAKV